ncbi:MAG: division/cell wall cluster transcriptional repressor MraZ [Chryseolinea sp.]
MTLFTYLFDTKLDSKGRLVLPSKLKAQLPIGEDKELVIRRGFEECLIIYPMSEFKRVFAKISALSEFNEEYRKLQRNFLPGAATVELDANGRLLIPKHMLTYAKLEREVTLLGVGSKVEAWNPATYQQQIMNQNDLAQLTEKVMKE